MSKPTAQTITPDPCTTLDLTDVVSRPATQTPAFTSFASELADFADSFARTVDRYVRAVDSVEDAISMPRKQADRTKCAVCREYKPTPLRNDQLGGYVCLTCIDSALIASQERERVLTKALKELLVYAGHYAKLLNMHDGGERKVSVYEGIDAWLETLVKTGVLDQA